MNIDELKRHDILEIESTDNEKMSVTTVLVVGFKKNVLVTRLMPNDNSNANFDSARIKHDVFHKNGSERTLVWRNCSVRKHEQDGLFYLLLCAKARGTDFKNRRNAFRQYIGEHGVCKLKNGEQFDVFIKDMSGSGFAFITSNQIDKNELPTISFDDVAVGYTVSFTGDIVRMETLPGGKFLYAGTYLNSSIKIDQYVLRKQQIAIQRERNKLK